MTSSFPFPGLKLLSARRPPSFIGVRMNQSWHMERNKRVEVKRLERKNRELGADWAAGRWETPQGAEQPKPLGRGKEGGRVASALRGQPSRGPRVSCLYLLPAAPPRQGLSKLKCVTSLFSPGLSDCPRVFPASAWLCSLA